MKVNSFFFYINRCKNLTQQLSDWVKTFNKTFEDYFYTCDSKNGTGIVLKSTNKELEISDYLIRIFGPEYNIKNISHNQLNKAFYNF